MTNNTLTNVIIMIMLYITQLPASPHHYKSDVSKMASGFENFHSPLNKANFYISTPVV